ncbi:response regulator [Sneathiella chinensis]|uniref:Response regulatory domain-containing protein n=1 Tax=Sneathiella chinensis TaxID=349750 RepID=A0ABQ5U108_9PROT|nr:response regulator [Sneathiella chinensis]GLQ05413.1 hypothetical protein GCM10007924_06340 [Sneathiella chinensis]
MEDRRFQKASVLLYDPQSTMRYNTRVALLHMGFGDVEAVSDFNEFLHKASTGSYDLIIGDTREGGGDTCSIVRDIRQSQVGKNPFVNVIVTLWDTSPDLVNEVIGCGADDLISRPMSEAQLRDRISGLITARKPFIVTKDYIGPERRQIVRGLSSTPPMVVPNSLQAKAENRPEMDATPDNIKLALEAVNERKISIYTEQFLRGSARILNLPETLEGLDERQILVRDMLKMNEDLAERLSGDAFAHVVVLCDAMRDLLRRILGSASPLQEMQKELLLQIPFAIHKACKDARESAEMAFDIGALSEQLREAGSLEGKKRTGADRRQSSDADEVV